MCHTIVVAQRRVCRSVCCSWLTRDIGFLQGYVGARVKRTCLIPFLN